MKTQEIEFQPAPLDHHILAKVRVQLHRSCARMLARLDITSCDYEFQDPPEDRSTVDFTSLRTSVNIYPWGVARDREALSPRSLHKS